MKDHQTLAKLIKDWIGAKGRRILSFLGWLYLARVSLLGLVVLFVLPLGARGGLRALAIGVFDLHLPLGAFIVGLMLPFAAWATFVTAGMVFVYGARRSRFDVEPPPEWVVPAWRYALGAAIIIHLWTIFAATDGDDRWWIIACVVGGLLLGMVAVAGVEEWHRYSSQLHRNSSHLWLGGNLYLFPIKSDRVTLEKASREQERRDAVEPDDWLRRGYSEPDGPKGWRWMPGHKLLLYGGLVFLVVNIVIFNVSFKSTAEMTALVYLLNLFTTVVLLGGGVSFFLDAYRLPFVSACIVWLLAVNQKSNSDHCYRIWASPSPAAEDAGPLTPREVLEKAAAADRPIVLVAIAGGGIQSSAWGTRVLTGLEEAVEEAREKGKLNGDVSDFAGSVQCISGVSGGASGAMFFVAGYGEKGLPAPRPKVPQGPPPPIDQIFLCKIVEAAEETSLGQAVWGMAYPDLRRAWLPFFIHDDYLDRAEKMERKWAQNAADTMGSGQTNLFKASLSQWQKEVRDGVRPAIIFNGTMVETGERICFSTAPPRDLVPGQREFVTFGPTTQENRGTQLYPESDLRITTAARLSATFPVISPAARPWLAKGPDAVKGIAPKDRDAQPDPGPSKDSGMKETVAVEHVPGMNGLRHVVDGGYYENTGLGALANWLDNGLTDMAKNGTAHWPRSILILQLEPFPSVPQEIEEDPISQDPSGRGTLFQIGSPFVALYNVRSAGHTASAERLIQALQQRWKLVPPAKDEKNPPVTAQTCEIQLVRFTIPLLSRIPGERRSWEPAWAEAKPDQPPLSWHLREIEKREIEQAWKALHDESVNLADTAVDPSVSSFGAIPKPPSELATNKDSNRPTANDPRPSAAMDRDNPGAWPVDRVIDFLKKSRNGMTQESSPKTPAVPSR